MLANQQHFPGDNPITVKTWSTTFTIWYNCILWHLIQGYVDFFFQLNLLPPLLTSLAGEWNNSSNNSFITGPFFMALFCACKTIVLAFRLSEENFWFWRSNSSFLRKNSHPLQVRPLDWKFGFGFLFSFYWHLNNLRGKIFSSLLGEWKVVLTVQFPVPFCLFSCSWACSDQIKLSLWRHKR